MEKINKVYPQFDNKWLSEYEQELNDYISSENSFLTDKLDIKRTRNHIFIWLNEMKSNFKHLEENHEIYIDENLIKEHFLKLYKKDIDKNFGTLECTDKELSKILNSFSSAVYTGDVFLTSGEDVIRFIKILKDLWFILDEKENLEQTKRYCHGLSQEDFLKLQKRLLKKTYECEATKEMKEIVVLETPREITFGYLMYEGVVRMLSPIYIRKEIGKLK